MCRLMIFALKLIELSAVKPLDFGSAIFTDLEINCGRTFGRIELNSKAIL